MTMIVPTGSAHYHHRPFQEPVHLGQDILLEASKYLDPIEYSAVSRLFWRVAEERAQTLLNETEDRCFATSSSSCDDDWSSRAAKTKWKIRMGLSVVEGYRGCSGSEETTSPKTVSSPKRKRCEWLSTGTATSSSSEQQEQEAPPALNLMASRLLWNKASRVPLSSTIGSFTGPSAMLPDGHHMAFFCPWHLQIIVVDVDAKAGNGSVVGSMSVEKGIPEKSRHAAVLNSSDVRLACTDNGELVLYCNHHHHHHCESADLATAAVPDTITSMDSSSPSPKRRRGSNPTSTNTPNPSPWCAVDDSQGIATPAREPPTVTASANKTNTTSCWISVWKIHSSKDENTPPTLEHRYLRSLHNNKSCIDDLHLSPVHEMAWSPSSKRLFLLRHNNPMNDDDCCLMEDHSCNTAAAENKGCCCWIESIDISSGATLALKQASKLPGNSDLGSVWNGQLSVHQQQHVVLLTLYSSLPSSLETNLRHFTLDSETLEMVSLDIVPSVPRSFENCDGDDVDAEHDEEDIFVQHAGRRILQYTCRSRCFLSDPALVSWTGPSALVVVGSDGRLVGSPKSSQSSQKLAEPSKRRQHQERWKLVGTLPHNKTGRSCDNYGLFSNPDEDEIVLDQVHLETGRKVRSIALGISRKEYFLETIHLDRAHRHGGDAFVVLSSVHRTPYHSNGSTIILRILSTV